MDVIPMANELLRKVTPRLCPHNRGLPCTGRSIRPAILSGVQQALPGSNRASLLQSTFEKKKGVESVFQPSLQKKPEVSIQYNGYIGLHIFSFTRNTKFLPRRPPEYRDTAYRSVLCSPGIGADPLYCFWRETQETGHRHTSSAAQKQAEVDCCGYALQTLQADGHCSLVSSEKPKANFHPEASVKMRGDYVFLDLVSLENREVECHSRFGSASSQKTQKRKSDDLPPAIPTAYEQDFDADSFSKMETYERESFTALVFPCSTGKFTTGNMSLSQYPLYCSRYSSTTARWDNARRTGKCVLFPLGERIQTRSPKQALKHFRRAVDKGVAVTYPDWVWEDYHRSPKSERETLNAGSKQHFWAFPKEGQTHIEDEGKQYTDNDAGLEGHLGIAKSKFSLVDSSTLTTRDVIVQALPASVDSSSCSSSLHAGLLQRHPQSHRNAAMYDFFEKRTGIGCCCAVLYQSAACVPCGNSRETGPGKDTVKGHVEGDGRTAATNSGVIHCSDRKRKIMNGTEYIRRKTGYRGRIRRNSQAPAYKRK